MTVMRLCFKLTLTTALFAGNLARTSVSQTPLRSEEPLRVFLRDHLKDPGFPDDETTEYSTASVDLNDDGKKEVIVYVTGRTWCGTGGCPTLILEPMKASFGVISEISITRPPIRVLNTSSRGWKNLTVWVQGGGILPGYEAELRFDGKTYPENPTVSPAQRLLRKATGKIVISGSTQAKHLYILKSLR